MSRRMNRRGFLRTLGGSAGVVLLAGGSARTYAANEKLHIAHVGCGGRGHELIGGFSRAGNIVAMCDVNSSRAKQTYDQFPDVPKFVDFRVMLDKMRDQIDAVVVATPDHTHAVATAAAMHAGKGVYCEKPLTRTVGESRAIRALARKQKVATSMGNQGTAAGPFRRALELIRAGAIGPVNEVHTWNDQGGPGHAKPPEGTRGVPDWLQWDLWLGPAAYRTYHPPWLHWSGWRDFGTGNLGNWASHTQNLAFMALKVDSLWYAGPAGKPRIVVEAKADAINTLAYPRWEYVRWDIPARGEMPPVSFHWHNGSRRPGMRAQVEAILGRELDWGDKGAKKWADWSGCLIVGTDGKIHTNGHNTVLNMLPADKFKDVEKDRPQKVDPSAGHERDWLNACRGGKPAWAHFDYSGPLTEFNMLGNVATQFAGKLEYDPLAGKIVNNDRADKLIMPEYRKGWSL